MRVTDEGVVQRCWDDVAEGDVLEGFDLVLTPKKVVEQVSGSQDFYGVHHDRDFARQGGHEDIFFNTRFTRGVLGRLLGEFVGIEGWLMRLEYSMRRQHRPGDVLRARGRVVRKYQSDTGDGLLDLELSLENDREGIATPATATVMLPRHANRAGI